MQPPLVLVAFPQPLFQRKGVGLRRSVAVAFDIRDDALRSQSQAVRRGGDDAQVGLVGNEGINVGSLKAVAGQQPLAGFRLAAYGKLEDLLAILVYVMHSLVYRFASRRVQAAAARHV